jgi:AbrB family looped-hinge helix DNA binding protein
VLYVVGSSRGAALLDETTPSPYLLCVKATLAEDGNIVIPRELRENAQLKPGDSLDVQFYKGTIVLRKHEPLTLEQCAALLERSRLQPKPTPQDDAAVEEVIQEVRSQRR